MSNFITDFRRALRQMCEGHQVFSLKATLREARAHMHMLHKYCISLCFLKLIFIVNLIQSVQSCKESLL